MYESVLTSKSRKDVLIDTTIVYLCVPLHICILSTLLIYFHEHVKDKFHWQHDIDLLIFPLIFFIIAIPLTIFRFLASNKKSIFHQFRVETEEKFLSNFNDNIPNLFRIDIILNIILITTMNLSGICIDFKSHKIPSYINMYIQSLLLLSIFDAGTYFGHRIFHMSQYYKYHKTHHKVRNTVALSLICIDIGDFFVNNIPILMLPFILFIFGNKMIYEVWIIGFGYFFCQGFIIHCDLYFISARNSLGLFWGDTVISHSLHHSKNIGHFSFVSPQIWDYIFNTQ